MTLLEGDTFNNDHTPDQDALLQAKIIEYISQNVMLTGDYDHDLVSAFALAYHDGVDSVQDKLK